MPAGRITVMGGRERRCSHKNYVIIGMMKVSRQYKKILPYRKKFFNAKGKGL